MSFIPEIAHFDFQQSAYEVFLYYILSYIFLYNIS